MSQFTPFGILFRYFAMRFVSWITLCLFGLAAIVSLVQTVELVRRVSVLTDDKPDVSFLNMAILNLPNIIEMLLPFAMLAGAMLTLALVTAIQAVLACAALWAGA